MLSKKAEGYLEDLIRTAEKHDYRVESNIFYNIYTELPECEKNGDTLLEMQEYLNSRNVEIVSDGLELEDYEQECSIDQKIKPFDPSKINITMKSLTLDALVKRLQNDEIDMETEFQRKAGLWSNVKKSQLIESVLLKIPLPAFYFDASDDGKWLIIDGLQRISAFREFIVEKTLKLEGMEFFGGLDGLIYDQLPRPFIRRIDETNLIAYTVNEGTPANVKFNIFKRINTGGLELEPQEIRHALYRGAANTANILLKKLSGADLFLQATCRSIRTERMLDQEFVLRFVAVCYFGIDHYTGIPDDFLNDTMEYINRLDGERIEEIERGFADVMTAISHIFGKFSFRKMGADGRRRPINKAVFEIWCKNVFDLTPAERQKAAENKQIVMDKYIELCENWNFQTYVKSSDRYSFTKRIDMVRQMIAEAII